MIRVFRVVMAMILASISGALVFYILAMGGQGMEFFPTKDDGLISLFLAITLGQITMFAFIILAIIVVIAMPLYLLFAYNKKDNYLSANSIGLLLGVIIGGLIYSSNPFGSLWAILTCSVTGVIVSLVFYTIARPFKTPVADRHSSE